MLQVKDPITWEAVYSDGSSLWECNPKGIIENGFVQYDGRQYIRFNSQKK